MVPSDRPLDPNSEVKERLAASRKPSSMSSSVAEGQDPRVPDEPQPQGSAHRPAVGASGLREKLEGPKAASDSAPAPAGQAEGGDEWRAAIERAKQRLAGPRRPPSVPPRTSKPVSTPPAVTPAPRGSAEQDEWRAALEKAKLRLSSPPSSPVAGRSPAAAEASEGQDKWQAAISRAKQAHAESERSKPEPSKAAAPGSSASPRPIAARTPERTAGSLSAAPRARGASKPSPSQPLASKPSRSRPAGTKPSPSLPFAPKTQPPRPISNRASSPPAGPAAAPAAAPDESLSSNRASSPPAGPAAAPAAAPDESLSSNRASSPPAGPAAAPAPVPDEPALAPAEPACIPPTKILATGKPASPAAPATTPIEEAEAGEADPQSVAVKPLPVVSVTTPPGSHVEAPVDGTGDKTTETDLPLEAQDDLPEIDVEVAPPELSSPDEAQQGVEEAAEADGESPSIEVVPSAVRSIFGDKEPDTARADVFGTTTQALPTPAQQLWDAADAPAPSEPASVDEAALTSRLASVALESLSQPETAADPNTGAAQGSSEQAAPEPGPPLDSEQQLAEHLSASDAAAPARQPSADDGRTASQQPSADDSRTASQQPSADDSRHFPSQQTSAAPSSSNEQWLPPEGWPRADWAPAEEAIQAPRRRGSVLKTIGWLVLVVAAFAGGTYFGLTPHGARLAARLAARVGAVLPSPKPRPAKSAHTPPPAKQAPEAAPPSAAPAAKDFEALEKKPAAERTLEEVTALGQHWLDQRNEEVSRLGTELRSKPDLLADENTRSRLMNYIEDKATAAQALTMLAQTELPTALDLIYGVWIRSSERTETTRIAEALLYASDVRPHASPALEVALALRTQPTACDEIRKIVDAAREHGDRRSAMLLVRTGSRDDCDNGEGPIKCRQCLDKKKKIRDVVKVVADRDAPYL